MDTKTNPNLVFSISLLCLYLKSHVCLADDIITANRSLSGDQTLVSASGIFELGFFKPGNSSNYYIGIWYNQQLVSAKTIVWVANREKPVIDRFSSVLRISDGNLVLFNESKSPIWSTNVASSSREAILLDNGNLVLRAGSSSSEPIWQSFDHPSDTWLPGARVGVNKVSGHSQILTSWKNSEDPAPGLFSLELDTNGYNSLVIQWNRSKQYWTSGLWDESSHTFSLDPDMTLNHFNYSYATNENETHFTYSLDNIDSISRCVMNMSGQVEQRTWLQPSKKWSMFWAKPKVYAFCGPFSYYNEKSLPFCKCSMGFEPKSPGDWSLKDYSGGCSRKASLQCGNDTGGNGTEDGFREMLNMLLPARIQDKQFNAIGCRSSCLSNCSCTAYAYGSSTGCSIWNGDVLGLQQVAADDGGRTLYIRLAASEFKNKKSGKRSLVIAIVPATAGLFTIVFGYFLWKKTLGKRRKRRKKYGKTKSNVGDGGRKNATELPLYRLESILAATNNFSEVYKLGEGGFGPVYKGILTEKDQEVAIKRLSKKSGQGHQEFMNELKLIANLQHTNLVRLLGCCIEEEEMILIYEYMPNRSLDKLLFDPSEKIKLDWGKRFRIVEGIAQGLLYLHKYSRLKIIHRDLKASNVLLDETMNPKVSDFGMARIFGMDQTEADTKRVVGTYGYMSPEYALYGHFSEKLDVFSFGVLLLEIVSGKKNGAFHRFDHSLTLARWAWELWKDGRGVEVIDESVREICPLNQALRCIYVAFLCVQEDPADRPTMSSVILMLQSIEATSFPSSKEPAFSAHRNSGAVSIPTMYSNNALTMSILEGR